MAQLFPEEFVPVAQVTQLESENETLREQLTVHHTYTSVVQKLDELAQLLPKIAPTAPKPRSKRTP
jgi:hypothetical protein